jgi:hypothetical protein
MPPPELDELPPELDELPPELDELPPELDEPAQGPVTTASHPCPQVRDDAQPSAGLWHACPAPPSGKVHECRCQPTGQHDPPPELDELPPELDEPTPELDEVAPDEPPPELEELPPSPDELPPPEPDELPPEPDKGDGSTEASLSPIEMKWPPLQPAAWMRATPTAAKAGAERETKVRFMKGSLVAALERRRNDGESPGGSVEPRRRPSRIRSFGARGANACDQR